MKLRKIYWIGMLLIPLLACEDVEETLVTETELDVAISLDATMVENTFATKSSPIDQFTFEGISTFCLAKSDNVKKCPGNVTGVIPGQGAKLRFQEIDEYQQISSLMLEWGYSPAGTFDFQLQSPVQLLPPGEILNEGQISINIDDVLSPVIQKLDSNPGMYILIKISGTSNFDINFDAELNIPVVVETELASPRFTL